MIEHRHPPKIVTASVGDGLDFACNLLVGALQAGAETAAGPALLKSLAQYIQFRYVGEYELALDELEALAQDLSPHLGDHAQLHEQIAWLRGQMGSRVV